jgi:hypothetical protein
MDAPSPVKIAHHRIRRTVLECRKLVQSFRDLNMLDEMDEVKYFTSWLEDVVPAMKNNCGGETDE